MSVQKVVSAATLCKFLGLKQRRIYQLADEGVLIKEDGHGGKFPLIENVNRYINFLSEKNFTATDEYDIDLNEVYKREKVRLTKAQADNEEIKARLAAKQVIEVDHMIYVLSKIFNLMRERLLSIPDRIENILVGEDNKEVFRKTLTAELNDSIYSISGDYDTVFDKIINGDKND